MQTLLIMGLPGSGKTMLSEEVYKLLRQSDIKVSWLNADQVRDKTNNWDFSEQGRLTQANEMKKLADASDANIVILDMVAALSKQRMILDATWTVWLDTMPCSRYADTDRVFEPPVSADIVVTSKNRHHWAREIVNRLFNK